MPFQRQHAALKIIGPCFQCMFNRIRRVCELTTRRRSAATLLETLESTDCRMGDETVLAEVILRFRFGPEDR
jgi:hypothetical protein